MKELQIMKVEAGPLVWAGTEGLDDPPADPLRASGDDHDPAGVPGGHGQEDDSGFVYLQLLLEVQSFSLFCCLQGVGKRRLQSGNAGIKKEKSVIWRIRNERRIKQV